MAEWEHKEVLWKIPQMNKNNITQWVREDNMAIFETKSFPRYPSNFLYDDGAIEVVEKHNRKMAQEEQTWKDKAISFVEFLDLHCRGGWEVFKISRNFNSANEDTWCIFRRLV
jgi:hypothetical protein